MSGFFTESARRKENRSRGGQTHLSTRIQGSPGIENWFCSRLPALYQASQSVVNPLRVLFVTTQAIVLVPCHFHDGSEYIPTHCTTSSYTKGPAVATVHQVARCRVGYIGLLEACFGSGSTISTVLCCNTLLRLVFFIATLSVSFGRYLRLK